MCLAVTIILIRNLNVKGKGLFLRLNHTEVALWLKKCTFMDQKGQPI
jgi:hypothetical protein